jgi:hypothetical protein
MYFEDSAIVGYLVAARDLQCRIGLALHTKKASDVEALLVSLGR